MSVCCVRRVILSNLNVGSVACLSTKAGSIKSNRRKQEVESDDDVVSSMSKFIDAAELSKKFVGNIILLHVK